MGQATHPMLLHTGKSQLWEWGSSTLFKENVYAWQTRKTLLGLKYILSFLNSLLILHNAHPWAPKFWTGGCLYRQRKYLSSKNILHIPNLLKKKIRRRYFRFTPRRSGFSDGDNFFFEFAMDRRWSFFRLYAWGQVHIFRFKLFLLVCVSGVPLNNHFNKYKSKSLYSSKNLKKKIKLFKNNFTWF